jgi:hypothetical protein
VGGIKLVFKETEWASLEWPYLNQVRKKWRSLIKAVMKIKGSIKFVEFLNWLRNEAFSRRTLLDGVSSLVYT